MKTLLTLDEVAKVFEGPEMLRDILKEKIVRLWIDDS